MAAKMKYLELSNAQIADKRRLVISECVKENQDTKENIQCGFTLAQQVEVEEGKRMTRVFLKKIKSFSKKTASFFKKMASFLKNVLIFFATAGTSTSDIFHKAPNRQIM